MTPTRHGHRYSNIGRMTTGVWLLGLLAGQPGWAQVDVWIDPGHGGDKPGNLGFSMIPSRYEKVLALQQSERLETRLSQIGFTSLKTRNGDNNPSFQRRADMAAGLATNDLGQQEPGQMLAIIHMNAGPPSALGTETFFANYKRYSRRLDAYRVDSTFASIIHCDLMTGANTAFLGCNDDRGVKCKPHFVSRRSRVPAVYIEVCFSTNQCQEANIAQAGDQALIANGIAAGISRVIVPGGSVSREAVLSLPAGGCAPTVECDFTDVADEPDPAPSFAVMGTQSLNQGFEGVTFPPSGWSTTTLGLPVPHRWHRQIGSLHAHFGNGAAFVGGESSGALDEWLISPEVILGTRDKALRFYWIGNPLYASDVSAECLVRPTGESSWTTVWSMADEVDGTEFTYQKRVVDLTPWASDTIQFAFKLAGANGADFALDDIAIGDFPPTTAPSHDLCANAIDLGVGSFMFTSNTCLGLVTK